MVHGLLVPPKQPCPSAPSPPEALRRKRGWEMGPTLSPPNTTLNALAAHTLPKPTNKKPVHLCSAQLSYIICFLNLTTEHFFQRTPIKQPERRPEPPQVHFHVSSLVSCLCLTRNCPLESARMSQGDADWTRVIYKPLTFPKLPRGTY